MNQENVGKRGAEDIMYLEEKMEQLYKIINKILYNNEIGDSKGVARKRCH